MANMKHLQHFTVAQKPASQGCKTFIKYFSFDFILFEAGEHMMSVLKCKRKTSTTEVTTAATKCHDIDQNKQVVELRRNWIYGKKKLITLIDRFQ